MFSTLFPVLFVQEIDAKNSAFHYRMWAYSMYRFSRVTLGSKALTVN